MKGNKEVDLITRATSISFESVSCSPIQFSVTAFNLAGQSDHNPNITVTSISRKVAEVYSISSNFYHAVFRHNHVLT